MSHHLGIIRQFSDKIMVMQKGVVVEKARTEELFNHPQHEYTQRLIAEQDLLFNRK